MKVDSKWFQDLIEQSPYGSQRQLAKAMRINQSTLSRQISGEHIMDVEQAALLAKFLGVSVFDVLLHAGAEMHAEAAIISRHKR